MSYQIIINSSSDLPEQVVKEFDFKVMPLTFNLEDKSYLNDPGYQSMPVKTFYQHLKDGKVATTSQLNTEDYIKEIEAQFKEGKDVLILSFSSGLSGSYNAARLALEHFKDSERKVYLVDTLAASLGEGLICYLAGLKQREKKTIEEVRDYVEELKLHVAHWFTVDDLMFLKRGGRLSGASAIIGSLLKIKPILHVDNEGKLIPRLKTIGRKKALNTLVKKLTETIDTSLSKLVFISHGDDLESANYVKERVLALNLGLEVKLVNYIGPVIGAHSGPRTIALFFTAKER